MVIDMLQYLKKISIPRPLARPDAGQAGWPYRVQLDFNSQASCEARRCSHCSTGVSGVISIPRPLARPDCDSTG